MGKGAIIKFKKSANDQNGVKKVNKDKARRVGSWGAILLCIPENKT